MFSRSSCLTGLVALLLSSVLLIPLASANPVPSPYRPLLVDRPGCPTNQIIQDINKHFIETISTSGPPKDFRDYNRWTSGWFGGNFTITDTTPNYPSPKKGVARAAPGEWAKSRRLFVGCLTVHIPEIRAIFDIKEDGKGVNIGGLADPSKCHEACYIGTYTAKLKESYGYVILQSSTLVG